MNERTDNNLENNYRNYEKLFGHIMRNNKRITTLIEGIIEGRGRPRT